MLTEKIKALAFLALVVGALFVLAAYSRVVLVSLVLGLVLISVQQHLDSLLKGRNRALLVMLMSLVGAICLLVFNLNSLVQAGAGMLSDIGQAKQLIEESLSDRLVGIHPMVKEELVSWMSSLSAGAKLADVSFKGLKGIVGVGVFSLLMPVLVAMLCFESGSLRKTLVRFIDEQNAYIRGIVSAFSREVDAYVWAKVVEAKLLFIASLLIFGLGFKLNYLVPISLLVALSVFLPFIGAVLAAIPLVAVGVVQFGLGQPLICLIGLYLLIQFLDGFLLAPWLFGKQLAMSSFVVLATTITLGSIFGLWGVLLAVPALSLFRCTYRTISMGGASQNEGVVASDVRQKDTVCLR
ncbi:AI-2E family transporter [Vibrio mediterranei]|uniref:AI-2E family transporter n=1 Tax=Vibrio mediterranei TaxID=689 RepID=UPI0040696622